MSETLSEHMISVVATNEWTGAPRRLVDAWAMEVAALEAKLEVMTFTLLDIKDASIAALALRREIDLKWIIEQIEAVQEDQRE